MHILKMIIEKPLGPHIKRTLKKWGKAKWNERTGKGKC